MGVTMKIIGKFRAREAYVNSIMVEQDPSITWKDAFAACRKNHPLSTVTKFARPGERIEGECTVLDFDTLTYEREVMVVNAQVIRAVFTDACRELGKKATNMTINDKVRDRLRTEYPEVAGYDRINLIKVDEVK